MTRIDKIFKYTIITLGICGFVMGFYNSVSFRDSIYNTANAPYVVEVAFNKCDSFFSVTQEEFDNRYLND